MTDIQASPLNIQTATVRYPDNYTDFLVAVNGQPVGYFTLSLGGSDGSFPAFIIGQEVVKGTEANYVGQTTRIINDKLYVVNSVYQFNITEELRESQVIPAAQLGDILLEVFLRKSGIKATRDDVIIMAQGPIVAAADGDEIHYMVEGLVFAKAKA